MYVKYPGARITKEALIAIVDSDIGGAVLLTIVLILISTIVALFNLYGFNSPQLCCGFGII